MINSSPVNFSEKLVFLMSLNLYFKFLGMYYIYDLYAGFWLTVPELFLFFFFFFDNIIVAKRT